MNYSIESGPKRAKVWLETPARHIGNLGNTVAECMGASMETLARTDAPRREVELGGEGGGWA